MDKCIFCKIANKEIPSKSLYEDNDLFAFEDINPKAKVHILVIPKKHFASLADLKEQDQDLAGKIMIKIIEIAREAGLDSYRVVTNVGSDAGQEVKHLHFHILGGETLGGIC